MTARIIRAPWCDTPAAQERRAVAKFIALCPALRDMTVEQIDRVFRRAGFDDAAMAELVAMVKRHHPGFARSSGAA